ncbi:MAG: Anaerobic C4-dicarboxylate transporter DcuB [Sodalis sp.]|uniref:anaerobic C4-dicarboxylate transporter family protein n=1 Tax=Sodalis sp. (in: enterobacteria) TaxID=1898979 RepID=UPI0038733357|nr:MAG: Anaerobic C4-dicarboxylate transporter DcuB [Sodalis sp.]
MSCGCSRFQASGRLDVLLQLAEKLLRRNPKCISLVIWLLTVLCGTGHVIYNSAHHLRCSDKIISAQNARQLANWHNCQPGFGCHRLIWLLTMPSSARFHAAFAHHSRPLCGILTIALFSGFRGKDLRDDDVFLAFINTKDNHNYVYGTDAPE